jgi:aminodeoxyfutalosine synthase
MSGISKAFKMQEIIKEKICAGNRLTAKEGVFLFESKDLLFVGGLADYVNKDKNGDKVYFNVNRHINPTNVCVNRCKFCAFSRDKEDKDSYEFTMEEILKRAEEAKEQHATELHIVGGLHPKWSFNYYVDMVKTLRDKYPMFHIQAFTAVEIDYFSKISEQSLEYVLETLKDVGLGSLPGGGAEIFHPEIRQEICPEKITGDRWLEVMETAHGVGLKSNCTMLYGHIEQYSHRIDHMEKLRNLQDKTGGFQAFIPLAFHPDNTKIEKKKHTSGFDDLKTLAIGRLYLDNFQHIKAFWIMLTEKVAQISLFFGVNDLDGTVVEEKITHSAGARTGESLTKNELIALIKEAKKIPVERDTVYNELKIY